jgi:ribosomal protein S18 acetylase RimI-like enzyme
MMKIRMADPGDLEVLAKNDGHIGEHELKNNVSLGRVYIMECQGVFAGWLRYNLFWDNTPFMNMLYLLSEYRGMGLGHKLVLFWEAQMRAEGYTLVMTSAVSSEHAQHFYYKLGYTAVGGFATQDGSYELLLKKSL